MTRQRREDVRRSIASTADRPNIFVRNLDGAELDLSKIELSSGTMCADGLGTRAGPYKKLAYLPAPPWRPAQPGIDARGDARPRLGFFRVPDEPLASLRALATLPPRFTQKQARAAAHPLEQYLSNRFGATEPLIIHGLNYALGGLETVTVNPRTGKYIGLHIDSWDGTSFEARRDARTRISVNVGATPRYLLILNLPFDEGAQLIRDALSLTSLPKAYRVLPNLFRLFPELPVLKIEVKPGEAYVADTDNLIHDASTLPNSSPAFHCTFRAHWNNL